MADERNNNSAELKAHPANAVILPARKPVNFAPTKV